MNNKNWGIGLAVACSLLFAGSAIADDRVDPDGDFSNLSQRLIIKYIDDQARNMMAESRNLSARGGTNLRFVRALSVRRHYLFQLDQRIPQQALNALMIALAQAPGVELVEEDRLMQVDLSPNDPSYPDQWHYFEATGGINLPPAWDKQTGNGVVLAVLDTGYTDHSDLTNVVPGYDFISDTFVANDGDGRDADAHDPGDWLARWECGFLNPPQPVSSSWHGTHVSGTANANTNNGTGVAGVAFDSMVLPVRVLGKCGGFTSDIVDGIVWASGGSVSGTPVNSYPAQVINMSFGGAGACGSTYQSAIDTARANGTTLVTSAGNSNANASGYTPSNCNGVIVVAANDRQGNRASYSNYGAVDVTAPGGETSQVTSDGVYSTLNDGNTSPGNESYAYYQGTSMASPHVAAAAALLYAADPSITPNGVETALESTARALPGTCSGGCGAGIIDANAAVVYVSGGNQLPTASFIHSVNVLTVTFTDTSTDNDGNIVSWDWDFGDGNISTSQNPVHTYTAGGTYIVTLTVTDDDGGTDTDSQSIAVSANNPPTASFDFSTILLTATFTDTSTDNDGSIVSWNWDFGDGNISSDQNPEHTYAASGTYTVSLTVTDDDGDSDTTSQSVTVDDGSMTISLSANGYKVRGRHNVDLSWSDATSTNVDIYRDGELIVTTPNDGFYTDAIGTRGGATYVHQVCEEGTSDCSNQTTTNF